MPDYEYVHTELAKPHVTLKLLWEEYVERCQQNNLRYYMETQFRRYYHKYAKVSKAAIRLEHKPGLSMEVDWAGTKIGFYDVEQGKMAEASLFVAVLPCSQLIFVNPYRDEKMPAWINGHVSAFEYIGAVPKTIMPDNLRTGVNRSNFYAPDLNKTYVDMAGYYGTTILPARVRKPKDKASVENSVLIASRKILAKLRHTQILSFSNLQQRVRAALEQINEATLTGKSESRWTAYLNEEKAYMLSLPESPYELSAWGTAKVQANCHVAYQRKFYSVPFEYLGEEVDARATESTIEIVYHHQRVASHRRLWGKNDYATVRDHMPPDKLFFADWDRERFLAWSDQVGPSTVQAVAAILDRAVIEQQAYRSCFGVMNLHSQYGVQKLERACASILAQTASPSYQQIKNIVEKSLDTAESRPSEPAEKQPPKRGFQRGADYFGGEK